MLIAFEVILLLCMTLISNALKADTTDCSEVTSAKQIRGFHVGNGGDVLVKRGADRSILAVKLLDFYESETQRRPAIVRDLGDAELSVGAKIEIAITRLERLDSLRAARLRVWLTSFFQEACFLRAVRLEDVPDSQHVQLPDEDGWQIEQIAVQNEPMFPEDARYVINHDLWDELDRDNKAGLILHELFYRDASAFDIEDSRGVRYLVAATTSHLIETWSQRPISIGCARLVLVPPRCKEFGLILKLKIQFSMKME